MKKKMKRPSQTWLCAMVTSALLFQGSGVSFAQDIDKQEQFALDEIVVTANRVPTPAAQAAANVTVITKDQIEKGPYSNLGDVLRAVNGVVVTGKGFGSSQQIVRLNGDDRVLVMIDGRRIGRPEGVVNGANIDLSTIISLNNIERIEVVKGGASALYGSDAVGGVINIITRKGTENKTTLDMSIGSWGERNYSLSTQGSEGGLSWYITADKKNQDNTKYNVLNPGLTPGSNKGDSREWENSKFEGQGFTIRLDKKIDDNHSLTFNVEHWDDEGGQPWEVRSPNQGLPLYTSTHLTNNAALTYNFNQQHKVPGFARVYTNYNNQDFYGTYKSRTQGFEYQTGWQLNNQHKLVTGVTWEKGEVLENVYFDEIQTAPNYKNKSITNTAMYVQDIYNLTDKWTMTPGLRYDRHSKFGGQTTPKLNVNYSADSTTDIYVSYNKVFKAPTLDQLYYDLYYPAYFSSMKGNPNLKPESGHVVSAGVNKKLSNSTSITANYFISKISDAIDWEYDNNWNGWARNIDEQKKHGFEVDVHHKLSEHYYTDLGYSYVHIENNENNTGYVVDSQNSQPNGYRVKVGFASSRWDVNLNGQSATGRDTKYFVDSGYWVWNLAANYKMTPSSSVYFNAYNLGNKAYEINSSSTGNSLGNYPMASRSFLMGVKYSF